MLKKNTAGQKLSVYAYDLTTGLPVTGDGANITGSISLDGAAPVAIADTNPTEVGGGWYDFDPTQGETNADKLNWFAESATENVAVIGGVDYTSIATDAAAAKTYAAAIKAKTDHYPYAIQPFTSTSTLTGRIDPTYLTAYQDSRLQAGPISVNDADGDPVNLGDKTLTLVAWEHDDLDTTVFELSTEGESPGLTVGGDDNNQVLIDADASNFATAGQLDYRIYDATDADNPSPLIDGVIEVVAGRAPVSEPP